MMPPDAAAMSGKQRQSASRPKNARPELRGFRRRKRELLAGRRRFAVMTVSVEAVMRRLAGARGPQMQAGFAARALKLDFSGFKFATRQQAVAVPAANLRGRCDRRFHKEPSLCGARRVERVCFNLLTMAMLEIRRWLSGVFSMYTARSTARPMSFCLGPSPASSTSSSRRGRASSALSA